MLNIEQISRRLAERSHEPAAFEASTKHAAVAMILADPVAADKTILRIGTLVPAETADDAEHWERNHQITRVTLDEDFALGEGIQKGLTSEVNSELMFGRFEGALTAFNQIVADTMETTA